MKHITVFVIINYFYFQLPSLQISIRLLYPKQSIQVYNSYNINNNYMKRKNLYTLLILLFFIILLTFFIQHRYFETLITIKDKPDELYFGKKDKISAIPNIIWAYWDNENLPEIVKICTESWKKHNPDYQIVILNNRTLKHYLPNIDISSMPRSKDFPARFSDFVRIFILEKYGGIWIDASSICNQPFYWVNSIQNHTKCECVCYYI